VLHDLTILALLPLGGWELAVVAIVFMLLFYGKRLPDIGRNMGRSVVEFKKGLSTRDDDEKQPSATPPQSEQDSGKTP
jgi:sec-independent protein translocase protein TatA